MKVILAKDFQKAMHKQSGKILNSIRKAVQEVVDAKSLDDITDLKKWWITTTSTVFASVLSALSSHSTLR